MDFDQEFERLVVKFRQGTGVRSSAGRLMVDGSVGPPVGSAERFTVMRDLRILSSLLKKEALRHEALFTLSQDRWQRLRTRIVERRGYAPLDLFLYVNVPLPNLGRGRELKSLAFQLTRLESVEIAYPETLTFFPEPYGGPSDWAPVGITPNLLGLQGYLSAAPDGVDAPFAWGQPGGTGVLQALIDIDTGVNENHEDLPALFLSDASGPDISHGTAALGVVGARADNGLGLKGVAPDAGLGFRKSPTVWEGSSADTILESADMLSWGDVILIETGKRIAGWPCPCNPTQSGTVAHEYYPAQFDAVQTAIMAGVSVVQVGGNGCVDYDAPEFDGWFDRTLQDSGSIIVGAGLSTSREPTCYSAYGGRIDLHAWAEDVVCLEFVRDSEVPVFNGGPDRVYGPNFGGTSSASAIVAGTVLSLSSGSWFATGGPFSPEQLREHLRSTGTPQSAQFDRPIGPMPDLRAAFEALP